LYGAEHICAKPVWRVAITSLWSPKIESACAASDRALSETPWPSARPRSCTCWGSSTASPGWPVNVVVSAPVCAAPCTAPAAPPRLASRRPAARRPTCSFCLPMTTDRPLAIFDEGVMDRIATSTSLHRGAPRKRLTRSHHKDFSLGSFTSQAAPGGYKCSISSTAARTQAAHNRQHPNSRQVAAAT